MAKRLALLSVMIPALILFMASLAYSQHSRRGGGSSGHGGGNHVRPAPHGGQSGGQHEGEGHATPRRHDPLGHDRAVSRDRPLPRFHPEYGQYYRGYYQGQYFFWRPYPQAWHEPNICIPGYWDWDNWYGGWVWIQGYCNIHGRYPSRIGFYFWF